MTECEEKIKTRGSASHTNSQVLTALRLTYGSPAPHQVHLYWSRSYYREWSDTLLEGPMKAFFYPPQARNRHHVKKRSAHSRRHAPLTQALTLGPAIFSFAILPQLSPSFDRMRRKNKNADPKKPYPLSLPFPGIERGEI